MEKLRGYLIVYLSFLSFVGCGIHNIHNRPYRPSPKIQKNVKPVSLPSKEVEIKSEESTAGDNKESRILTRGEVFEKMIFDHSPENATSDRPTRKLITKWIEYFTQNDAGRFQRYLDRGQIYKDVIQTLLTDNELHPDLYYLGLIESGYSTHARSRASAVGAWQFVRATAKRYDLQVNYYVDERKDPIRSTDAASKYLTDLYNVFHSWELAMAAYNCGEYRVLQAIMKGKTRDFWELADKKLLPRETRNYVPKLIAAVVVGRDPESYGLRIPLVENEYPNIEAIEVPSPIKLKDISKEVNIPYKILTKINPHLTRGVTPPHLSMYEVWVPEGKGTLIKESIGKLAKLKIQKKQYWAHADVNHYKVRRGDNLHVLAKKFRVTVNFLKRINNLRSNRIFPGQKLRISSKSYRKKSKRIDGQFVYVRRGDSLSSISMRYGVTISRLKQINNLKNNRIYVGQRIKIFTSKKLKTYIVKRGDNLGKIARMFKVSIRKLKKLNSLRGNRIYIGQRIAIQ